MKRTLVAAASLLAVPWFVTVVMGRPSAPIAFGAPPHLAEGDLLAGAMYPWAETDDAVAIEPACTALSLHNDGDATTTHLDAIALAVFDEPVVRTASGTFVAVRDTRAAAPTTTTEGGRAITSVLLPDAPSVVVLDAKSTRFAETAYFRYVAKMGRGLDPIMERAVRTDCPREHTPSDRTCASEVMEDEQRRLGLPLLAEARDDARVLGRFVIYPPGAKRTRSIALPVPKGTTSLRLEATPGFWEIERIGHGRHDGERLPSATLAPTTARVVAADGTSRDATSLVASANGVRSMLGRGERLDVTFAAHDARAAYVVARGHYRVPIGGRSFVDPLVVAAHRAGVISLPRFAHP